MEKDEAISLYVYLRLEMPIVKSHIEENTAFTYEDYCDMLLEDVQFRKNVFQDFVRDEMGAFIDELVDLVETNKVPVHISSDKEAMG